jgi:hypothetical protein
MLMVSGMKGGGENRNRTDDTRIFSPLLYHLSYLAMTFLRSSFATSYGSEEEVRSASLNVSLTVSLFSKRSHTLPHATRDSISFFL